MPGDEGDEAVAGRLMASSPPPYKRRTSCASTMSDITSSTLPLSASYQCLLLSPLWTTAVLRRVDDVKGNTGSERTKIRDTARKRLDVKDGDAEASTQRETSL